MVPPEFRRKFTIISGSISLIQAIVWALVAIYSIGLYKCVFPFPSLDSNNNGTISIWHLFYETYFQGNCGAAIFLNFKNIPESAKTTELWMIIYSLISSIWIPCCILLIVAAAGEVRGIYGSYLYYPWILVTTVIIVIDVIAGSLHLNDVFSTLTRDTYAHFITGNSTENWVDLTQNNAPNSTYLPSLFLTLFFCRAIILWILNIFMLIMIIRACHSVAMYKTRYQETVNLTNKTNNQRNWLNMFYQGKEPSLINERTTSNRGNEHNSIQEGIDSPLQNSIKDSEQEAAQKSTPRLTVDLHKTPQTPQKWTVDEFGIPLEEIIPRVNSRRGSVERSNSGQNKGRVFDYLGRPSSFGNISGDRSPPSRGLDHLPPAELRNQMPFSYFKPINALPPKPAQRSNHAGDAPPVPVPDYTLHFNRNPGISSPNTPGNRPRIARQPTEEFFKFPPPLKRTTSEQGIGNPQYQYYPNPQAGVRYVPPVRPNPLAYGVQVYPQSPQTPGVYLSGSRNLTMENSQR